MRCLLALPIVALALFAAACTPAELTAPPGFAQLDDPGAAYSYRAMSADGVVVAARAEKNLAGANADFWSDALDLRLRKAGYVAETTTNVKTTAGLLGKERRYVHEDEGRTYRYWVAVFTTEKKVYVVEAAGDKDAFDPDKALLEKAVVSLETR